MQRPWSSRSSPEDAEGQLEAADEGTTSSETAGENAAYQAYLDCLDASETAKEWTAWKTQSGETAPPCATCDEADAALAEQQKAWEDETYANCYTALENGWTAEDALHGFYLEDEHLRGSPEFGYRSDGCQQAVLDWQWFQYGYSYCSDQLVIGEFPSSARAFDMAKNMGATDAQASKAGDGCLSAVP